MPNTGDSFITILKQAHLQWGSHRHTNSRGILFGEGYLQIPASIARRQNITNSNSTNTNVYLCSSTDGFLNNVNLKATGCSHAGSIHAKQFHGSGNLQLLGHWFNHINAQIGDQIRIDFITPTEILLTKI
ncbi:hypothetical protein [Sphingobacterium rhinopitheci]|uniref:hypothetical protein n=1 Tax=Sphingobacterium rhinopitheci TaxID=2781960 RepID=UPI001F523018|nr:hypothetical protein [Sphingobacterium rhinopitheci]MCI0922338.1 hypothetical protein [Sphingobacterium rhinopitheci]